jgi:hypothetical protein
VKRITALDAEDAAFSGTWPQETHQDLDRRCLASAVTANQPDNLPRLDRKRDIADRLCLLAKGAAESLG